ncbi:DegT/DnrJ/EryC1/StrS family aminotransferase [Candidatus Poribacteria bacterium]|nr:DegT/DnrJ/EryC1/StrS family aminotransferase [Candidatus Poribacteria bacterium]
MSEALAIAGGTPIRTTPFPPRRPFGAREEELVLEAIRSQNLFGKSGNFVPRLETEFAQFMGSGYAQTCTSGTAAIHIAVGAVNPDPGDEIITAPITDPGSVMPILQQNAIPVFADVDPITMNMTPESIEANITDRTRAIILVHLFGRPCEIEKVVEIARRHNVTLIEDCSQTHATRYKGKYVGTFGDIGCFSLQQSKHMTTGDGGICSTDDQATYYRMKLFSDKGWDYRYMGERDHAFLAPNYRMNELTAAVAVAQLARVRQVVEKRHRLGRILSELIADAPGITVLPISDDYEVSWWNYVFHITGHDPGRFCEAVRAEGVPVGPHYIGDPIYLRGDFLAKKITYGKSQCPFSCHVTSRNYEYTRDLVPGAVQALKTVAIFGLHEDMSEGDIEDVGAAIQKVARNLAT